MKSIFIPADIGTFRVTVRIDMRMIQMIPANSRKVLPTSDTGGANL